MRRMILVAIAAALVAATTVAAGGRDRAQAVGSTSGAERRHALEPGRAERDLGRPATCELRGAERPRPRGDLRRGRRSRGRIRAVRGLDAPLRPDLRRRGRGRGRPRCARHSRAGPGPDRRVGVHRVPRRHPGGSKRRRTGSASVVQSPARISAYGPTTATTTSCRGCSRPRAPACSSPFPREARPSTSSSSRFDPCRSTIPARFRPNGPDSLTSSDYTADFNDVQGPRTDRTAPYGRRSRRRSRASGPSRRWSSGTALSGISRSTGASTRSETARMMAMAHVSAADTLVGLLGGQVLLQLLAPAARDPACRLGWEPRHRPGHDLDASAQRQPPGVPLGALLLHLGDHPCVGGVLRHRQGPAHDHQHRDRDDPQLRPAPRREEGGRPRPRLRRAPLQRGAAGRRAARREDHPVRPPQQLRTDAAGTTTTTTTELR